MAPPIRKGKNFFSDNRRLISSTEISEHEQQQPMGSLVTAFGKRRSVRMAKKMNRRLGTNLKRWICSDVLMDILPFFDRPQLGLKLALLSPRFNALVDTHFDGKSELTLWKWMKINKDSGPKPQLSVLIDGKFVGFPLPDRPLPNKIRFNQLWIDYIDHSVIEFLRANKQIWDKSGTNLELTLCSSDNDDDEHPIWDVLAREIWPIFAPSIRHLGFFDDEQFDELCQRISPTILTDLDQLVSINCDLLMLDDVIADDDGLNGISVEQVLSEWLNTPRKDGKPKRLFCEELDGEGNIAWLNSFKETFVRATDASVSYQICFGIEEPTIEPFELVNERTKEKLTLKEGDYIYWLLKRCPISEKAATAVQWETNKNWDEKLNCVKFNLFAASDCIGPLSPPAEGPSGWAQQ